MLGGTSRFASLDGARLASWGNLPVPPDPLHWSAVADKALRAFPQTPSTGPLSRTRRSAPSPRPPPLVCCRGQGAPRLPPDPLHWSAVADKALRALKASAFAAAPRLTTTSLSPLAAADRTLRTIERSAPAENRGSRGVRPRSRRPHFVAGTAGTRAGAQDRRRGRLAGPQRPTRRIRRRACDGSGRRRWTCPFSREAVLRAFGSCPCSSAHEGPPWSGPSVAPWISLTPVPARESLPAE